MLIKNSLRLAGKMSQQLRELLFLLNLCLVPALITDPSQPSVTPAPGHLIPSSGWYRYLTHVVYTHTDIHTNEKTKINIKIKASS